MFETFHCLLMNLMYFFTDKEPVSAPGPTKGMTVPHFRCYFSVSSTIKMIFVFRWKLVFFLDFQDVFMCMQLKLIYTDPDLRTKYLTKV